MYIALCALLPLLLGGLSAVLKFRSDRARNLYVECVTLLTSAASLCCVLLDKSAAVTLFRLGGGFDCVLGIDGLSRLFIGLISILWPLACLYAFEYMEHEERTGNFFAFYTMAFDVALLLAAARNLFTLYIFYECLTIVTLPLVEHGQNKESYRAGRTYLIYLIGGASLGFASLVMISGLTGGATSFTPGGLVLSGGSETIRAAFVLLFVGFGVKAAVFPLCRWLTKASVAPTPVTALLHAVAVVNAGVFSVARGVYYIFPPEAISGSWAQCTVLILSALSVVYGAVREFRETHLKRRLAWSTVSNLGYMLVALSLLSREGCLAGLNHMVFHSLMKIVLFFCAGAVIVKSGKTDVHELGGEARKMPFTFFAFTLAGAALTGVPPLCGFTSKYLLITAAFGNSSWVGWVGAVSLIVSAVLTAFYIFTVIVPAYFKTGMSTEKMDMGIRMKLSVGALCILIVFASVYARNTYRLIGVLEEGV